MSTITRSQYMASISEAHDAGQSVQQLHEQYYEQFVTEATLRHVGQMAEAQANKLAALLQKDQHLNQIPLDHWDRMTWRPTDPTKAMPLGANRNASGPFMATLPLDRDAIDAAGEWVTRSTLVCIAKAAARMIAQQQLVTQ